MRNVLGLLIAFALVHAALGAKVMKVGTNQGWVIQKYADVKLKVGDSLYFVWPQAAHPGDRFHDVRQMLTPAAWATCDMSKSKKVGTNHVVVKLTTPGWKYFACGVLHGTHCMMGQKLRVYVSK